jgi:hypothetical protein
VREEITIFYRGVCTRESPGPKVRLRSVELLNREP